MHYCAVYHAYEIAEYILAHKGSIEVEDKHGNQPLWTALIHVHHNLTGLDMVKLFIQHGADKDHLNKVSKSPALHAAELDVKEITQALSLN